jgi:hypothetical protein
MRWRVILTVALASACLAVPLAAFARRASATHNHVSAGLTGTGSRSKLRLRIKLNGRLRYDQAVRSPFCGSLCATTAVTPGKSAVKVADLESNGQPDVVLGLYSGGAHCCFIDQVFSLNPATTTYVKVEHNFLDAGATITRLDAHYEFLSADARIAEAGFTDYADSGAPIQIWRFQGRRFRDVTRQYPKLITPDAARWMRLFKRDIRNGVGLIAAWAADEDLLGNQQLVSSTLNAYAAHGMLHSALGLPHNSATAFVAELQKALRQLGYAK